MTPQQLIDLPGYGNASKHVKAMGYWRETLNDTERIEWLDGHVVSVIHVENTCSLINRFIGSNWSFGLRGEIDFVASECIADTYSAYKEK